MRPLTAAELSGTWSPLLLPIEEDDSIDFAGVARQIEALIRHGVDGIYTNGTAGEFDSQSEEEFDRLSVALAEACEAAGMPFQIGASHTSAAVSRQRLRRAARLAPGAIQLILPDWSPPTLQESISFLRTMAEEAGEVGLVLYNPPRARRVLSPRDLARLKDAVPSLVGIKVAGGDAAWFEEMARRVSGVSIFVPGHRLAEGVRLGASGSYSNVACLNPRAARDWYREMREGDAEAARALGVQIQAFLRAHIEPLLVRGLSHQAADKLLAAIGGWTDLSPRVRWPYESVADDEVRRLREIARDRLPELMRPWA